jgi:hypothetical protein
MRDRFPLADKPDAMVPPLRLDMSDDAALERAMPRLENIVRVVTRIVERQTRESIERGDKAA